MAEFTYQARNAQGKTVSGSIAAQNESDAVGELRKQSLTVLSLSEKAGKAGGGGAFSSLALFGAQAGAKGGAWRKVRVKEAELIVFTRQLATMLSAGIPLLECLEILAEQAEDIGFRAVIAQCVEDVRAGSDFSEALKKHPGCFSNIYVNMIKAGEASGQLDDILTRLADYNEAAAALKGRIKSAMTYPIVSLVLIISIVTGLLVFIVPKFQEIFEGLAVELPLPTIILLKISSTLTNYWYLWLVGIPGIFFAIKAYGRTNRGGYQLDWLTLRLPIFGPLFKKVAISRFTRTFATLIQSGVPILAALEIVAATSGNRIIEESVMDASTSVRQGETLAVPLGRSGVFPPMVCRMIAIGEKSGALESLLEKISEFYDQQVDQTVESLTSLIEPLMIAIMGVMVGGMVLAIFMPIMKLVSAMK
jgi:type IV pilus assembly protein PilC